MKKSISSGLITVFFNLLFINACVFSTVFVSFLLGKYNLARLYGFVFIFVGLLALYAVFFLANKWLIRIAGYSDNETIFSRVENLYAALLVLVLATIVGMPIIGMNLTNAFKLLDQRIGESIAPREAPAYSDSGFVQFETGAAIDKKNYGVIREPYEQYVKAGSYTRTGFISYYAFPVIPADWKKSDPVYAWMCENVDTDTTQNKKNSGKPPELLNLNPSPVRGIPLPASKWVKEGYGEAAKEACARHMLKMDPRAVFMKYEEKLPEEMLGTTRIRFTLFIALFNLIGMIIILVFGMKLYRELKIADEELEKARAVKEGKQRKKRKKKKR